MKTLLISTALLIGLLATCHHSANGQAKVDSLTKNLKLSVYEGRRVAGHENFQKEISAAIEKEQREYGEFIVGFFTANSIPLNRLSQHPDSLKITPTEIMVKLRKLKTHK